MKADANTGITPGPWVFDAGGPNGPDETGHYDEPDVPMVCHVDGDAIAFINDRDHSLAVVEANGRAIAEVPIMIEALDWLLDALDAHVPDKSPTMLTYYEQAKATYKRATGHDHSSSGQDQLRRIT